MLNKKNTMSYYSTLFSKYRVDDSVLENRTQKRAVGTILEQIDKEKINLNEKIDKSKLKKLRRAFSNTLWFRKMAASLTFATALSLFQTPSANANTISIIKKESNYSTSIIDEDSLLESMENKSTNIEKILNTKSLHFISNEAASSEIVFSPSNTVFLDDDSDVKFVDSFNPKHLTVIDTTIDDWKTLAKNVKKGSILLLKKDDNFLENTLNVLSKLGKVDSLNIVTHGSSGEISFSSNVININTLKQNKSKWEELGKFLSKNGDILLYGCNIAKGNIGKEFIQTLADYTKSDIAASTDLTGPILKGADWDFEEVIGSIDKVSLNVLSEVKEFTNVLVSLGSTKTYVENTSLYSYLPTVSQMGDKLLINYYDYPAWGVHNVLVGTDGIKTSLPSVTISPRTNDNSDTIIYKALSSGNILVIWYSSSSGKAFTDTYFKIINSSGTEVVGATKINSAAGSLNRFTEFAELSNGKLAFVWATDGSNYALRRFNSDGTAFDASQISVTSTAGISGSQYAHKIAANPNGTFMILIKYYNPNLLGMIYSNDSTTPTQVGGQNAFIVADQNQNEGSRHLKVLSDGKFLTFYEKVNGSTTADRSAAYVIHNTDGSVFKSETIIRQTYSWGDLSEPIILDGGFLLSYYYNDLGSYGPALGKIDYLEEYNNSGVFQSDVKSQLPTLTNPYASATVFLDVDQKASIMVNDNENGESQMDTWLLRHNPIIVPGSTDTDSTLTSGSTVSEPVNISTIIDTVGEAVDLFDFTITDSGSSDGLTTDITQLKVNVSGTSTDTQRANITWRLDGPDASNVIGIYDSATDTVTFSSLAISITDGSFETYTINAYFNDNSGVTDNATFVLSIDGDTDVTADSAGSTFGSTSPITNGSGTTSTVSSTSLLFSTQPAGSVSGSSLTTQPIVKAVDAFGNIDIDYTSNITVTENDSGSLSGTTTLSATSGVATFTNIVYTATADQEVFQLDAASGSLNGVTSNNVTSDVVATKLIFTTQPSPLSFPNATSTSFSTVPVVKAVDANDTIDTGYSTDIVLSENGAGTATMTATSDNDVNSSTVSITPSSGVSTFTSLNVTYTASGSTAENFTLRAISGALTAVDSSQLTATFDTTAPTISSITIPNTSMKVGDTVTATITVTSDSDDYTTGSGGISGTIGGFTLSSLSKTNNTTYTATFTVTNGGTDVLSGNDIPINFTLTDSSGNTSSSFTTAISQGSDSIDANIPTVSSVSVPSNGTYVSGNNLDFTVNTSENVTVNTIGGTPRIAITIGSTTKYATYISGSGTSALVFRYTVESGLNDTDGIAVGSLSANSGTLKDSAGNDLTTTLNSVGSTTSVLVDSIVPTVSSVSVPSNGTYVSGNNLDFTVNTSENVTVNTIGGTPRIAITIGSTTKYATYISGSGTSALVFRYTVESGLNDTNGIAVGSLSANSGTLKDSAGNDLTTTLNSVGSTTSVLVDSILPTLSNVTMSSNNSDSTKAKVGDVITLLFTSSETLNGTPTVTIAGHSIIPTNPSGNNYTASYMMTNADSEGNVSFTIDFSDTSGNNGTQVTTLTTGTVVVFDKTIPTITITSDKDALKSEESTAITFILSESSTDFTSTDVTVVGGSLSNFIGSGTTYTATFTPSSNSTTTGTIDVNASKFTDASGNDNSAATQKTITIDTVIPTVTISSTKNNVINGEELTLSFLLSEDSSTFTDTDITINGGTISNFVQDSTNSKLYTTTLTVDNTTTTAVTIDVNATTFTDAAGNDNSAATQKTLAIIPSVLTYTPADNSTDIALDSSLKLEFSEEVVKGTGNIVIYKALDDSVIETIDVTSSKVSIQTPTIANGLTNTVVTIAKDTKLDLLTDYYVQVDATAFKDVNNNFYTGINNKTTWFFTTVDNQAPVITSNSGNVSATINVDENQTALIDIDATDVDVGQTLTYSLEGTDASSFNIDSSTGVITFKIAPNYENKNSYSVDVKVSDDSSISLSDTQSLTININDVNDDPVITIANSLTTNEDTAKDLVFSYTDEDSNTITAVEKTAPTNGTIAISGTTITYTPNVNYNGNDSFVLTLSDGNGYSVDKTINVTVNPVDDAPNITTTFENQTQDEDGKGLVIDLTTSDIDNNLSLTPATYSVISSDENIAVAYIVRNRRLIVVPKENANGTVTITVTTTVNGLSSSKSFTYILTSVNDAPSISTISDISHEQTSSVINKIITFDIWDDIDVISLSATSSNENLIASSDIQVNKLSSTQGELSYTISANNSGTATITISAKDVENLEYKESFNVNVNVSNDSLCVENAKTALSFDSIKLNNISQDAIISNLDLVNSLASVCDATISWNSTDNTVVDNTGIVTQSSDNKTIMLTADIVKGEFSSEKSFLITVLSNSISDTSVLEKITFETIKEENDSRYQVTSKLNLPTTILEKSIVWTSSDDSVISPYSGYVTRASTDKTVTLTATIGSETKTFELKVLKEETTNLDSVTKDAELLTINSLLGQNSDKNSIIYNLAKPLLTTGANGSTISWSSSNRAFITNEGDVLRDSNADKYIVLTATITKGSETITKEFNFKVLQNKIETASSNTFKNAGTTISGTQVTTTSGGQDTQTSSTFASTILGIVDTIISQDSIKSVVEFVDKVVNLYLNTDGSTTSTLQTANGSSSLENDDAGASTQVQDDGNITSSSNTSSGSVKLYLNTDGTVSHEVVNSSKGKTTSANSNISNSSVKKDSSGNVETTSEVKDSSYLYKAVVSTDLEGKTTTKFVKIDLSTGDESEVNKTVSDNTPYEVGNKVEISEINGILYIKTTTPLSGNIVIE